jgi:hypothetical protein
MENNATNRRKIKSASTKINVSDIHVANCRVLPSREQLLDNLPKNAICAEIGVDVGDFSAQIIQQTSPSLLHLVDAWSGPRYSCGLEIVRQRLGEQIKNNVVEIHQGLSTDVLENFPPNYFDWVYIDSNHTYETTRDELAICEEKTKANGRIAGHDFTSGNVIKPWPYGVIEACNEFCVKFDWEYEFLTLEYHGHFSFCLKKMI